VSPASKLGAFALVLGVALGGGAVVGNAVGPIDVDSESDGTGGHGGGHESSEVTAEEAQPAAGEADQAPPGGLQVSQSGYTLVAPHTALTGAPATPFTFQVTGPDGAAVRDFETLHERELHLVVVGRDLRAYAHLHPTRAGDGTWTVSLPALAPGTYRAFADFAVSDGPELTLGVDLTVAGTPRSRPVPPPATTAAVDGYEVALAGTPAAGSESELELTVSRGGEPVTDLEPYLGAAGHLVAIRSGDMAYLHVHPLDDADRRNGPGVRFAVEVPSPGDYRLFFDFAHEGQVRTAAFTVHVPAAGEPAAAAGGHGHDTTTHEES
jgi:hypothetical protein